jgi:adenylate kinase
MSRSSKMIPQYNEPFKAILLIGPPGSGKGTLGKFLSSAGNHFHLSSGDIFRGLSLESPAGKLYHSYAGKGLLLPDEVTIEIWHHFVLGLIATNRYFPEQQYLLMDGIPRTKEQAKMLKKYLHVEKIIHLRMSDTKALIERMQRRGIIEKRADDQNPEILAKRMKVYEEETKPILDFYPKEIIKSFHADQRPLELLRDVLQELCPVLS